MTGTTWTRRRAAQRRVQGWKGARAEIVIHAVASDDGLWIHTHGLRERDLPELEIRGAPTWMSHPGAKLLNALADYLVQPAKPVCVGDVIEVDGFGTIQLVRSEPREPIAEHYDHERWAIVDAPKQCVCGRCRAALRGASHTDS